MMIVAIIDTSPVFCARAVVHYAAAAAADDNRELCDQRNLSDLI